MGLFGVLFTIIGFSFPIFYLYGLYCAFGNRGKKSDSTGAAGTPGNAETRQQIIDELSDAVAHTSDPVWASGVKAAIEYLKYRKMPVGASTFAASTAKSTKASSANVETKSPSVAMAEAATQPSISSARLSLPNPTLDSANVLLFVGAFLIMAAVGIFTNYSYAYLTGFMKTGLVAILSLGFFGSGLALVHSAKLKPAGIAFAVIGMLSLPLVGVAAYNFWLGEEWWRMIWLLTSVACVFCYWVARQNISHHWLDYLLVGAALSVFQATVGMFMLPTYVFYWALAIFAIGSLLIRQKTLTVKDRLYSPVQLWGQIALVASFILSMYLTLESGAYFQLAINALIVGLYFAILLQFDLIEREYRVVLGSVVGAYSVAAVALVMSQGYELMSLQTGLALFGVALISQVLQLACRSMARYSLQFLTILLGGLQLAAVGLVAGNPGVAVIMVAIALIGQLILLWLDQDAVALFMSFVCLLVLPVVMTYWLGFELTSMVSALLMLVAWLGIVGVRLLHQVKDPQLELIHWLGHGVTLGVAARIAHDTQQPESILILGAVAVGMATASYLEKAPKAMIVAMALSALTIFKMNDLLAMTHIVMMIVWALGGLAWYGIAKILPDETDTLLSRAAGVWLVVATWLGFTQEPTMLVSTLPLLGLASITMAEYTQTQIKEYLYISVACLIATAHWMLQARLEIEEVMVYSVMWAGYFGWLATEVKEEQRDFMIAIALSCLTVPLAMQAFTDDFRGLVLIGESLLLILIGLGLGNKLVWRWGVAVLIGEVLYYTQDFFYSLPTWAVFGGLGIVVLAGAVVLLQRQNKTE